MRRTNHVREFCYIDTINGLTDSELYYFLGSIPRDYEQVRTRQWKWLGHVLRMPSDKNPKITLMWAPEGKRRRGQLRDTWGVEQ